jgi:hypothetical protein
VPGPGQVFGEIHGPLHTDNGKLSIISWNMPFAAAVPFPVGGSLDQADNQFLMWQDAERLWGVQPFPSGLKPTKRQRNTLVRM